MYDITNMSDLGLEVFFAVSADDVEGLNYNPADLTRADWDVLLPLKNAGKGYDAQTWRFILGAWQEAHVAAGVPKWANNSPDYEGRILRSQVDTGDYD